MKKILSFIDSISEWTGRIFCWVITVIVLLIVFEVVSRRFFNSPFVWHIGVTVQFYAFNFLILAAYTLLHNAHVAIDILYMRFSKRTKAILDVITYAIFFFPFFGVILYRGIQYAGKSWEIYEKSWGASQLPLYPIKTVIPIMAFLVLLQGVAIFIRKFYFVIKGKEL